MIQRPSRPQDWTPRLQNCQEIIRGCRFRLVYEELVNRLQDALGQAVCVLAMALREVLAQYARGPLGKARGAAGADPVTHGDHRIQVAVLEAPQYPAAAFLANYRENLGSCPLIELGLRVQFL